jgi:hypothetical protein
MGHEDLRDLIAASELHDRFGDIAATKHSRFDLQAPSEANVLFYRLSLLDWQFNQLGGPMHE